MKSPCNMEEGELIAEDTLFTFGSNNKKITMIPLKYKLKEERRKVIKISLNKLKKIDDPESSLRRSVLINNTMKKLQKEAREEKLQKQLNTYSRTYFIKTNNNNKSECFYEFNKYDWKNEPREGKPSRLKTITNKILDNDKQEITDGICLNEDVIEHIPSIKRCSSRKRSLDEDGSASEILNLNENDVEDSEVHDVLSQLYLPPTPRLLSTIDSDTDEEEIQNSDKRKLEHVEDSNKKFKKSVYSENYNKENFRTSIELDNDQAMLDLDDVVENRLSQITNYKKNNENNNHYFDDNTNNVIDNCDNQFSCGHSSIFNDIQSVNFHNLITSLET